MAEEKNTVGTIIALILVIASFMYLYDFFIGRAQLDMLLAIVIFAGSLVWLFSNIWGKK